MAAKLTKPKDLVGNMMIAQSGGPTVVINQSLVGAVLEAKTQKNIKKIYGALHGIQGILDEDFVELQKETKRNLEAVALTPSSGLGSVRKKPTPADCANIFQVLQKYGVRYFFYIGGNDTAETTHIINEEARKQQYEFRCFHIPKTIDNDLRQNDHTPGFGSSAKFVASAFMGDNLDNRALKGVKINIVMGRDAGFLTAAAALGRRYPDDGPHLIYLPECPFSLPRFVRDVKAVYRKYGRCLVAVSEGICDNKGVAIISKVTKEVDSHGNAQLSGTGALGDILANEVKAKTKIKRVRADTFGYLQRSFPGVFSEADAREARASAARAVRCSIEEFANGSIAIKRKPGKRYAVYYARVSLNSVAKKTRHMPARYIHKSGNNVTQAFIDYAAPLVGELPPIGRLKGV
ncbi:MAG: 6-phosphofructokinase [Verrucomicrobiota bacterium]